MIQLTGKLLNINQSTFTNRGTGETSITNSAEILHTVGGRLEVIAVKLDSSIADSWSKAVNRDILVEVRSYALKREDGTILAGYMLADKRALPGLVRAASATAPATASA